MNNITKTTLKDAVKIAMSGTPVGCNLAYEVTNQFGGTSMIAVTTLWDAQRQVVTSIREAVEQPIYDFLDTLTLAKNTDSDEEGASADELVDLLIIAFKNLCAPATLELIAKVDKFDIFTNNMQSIITEKQKRDDLIAFCKAAEESAQDSLTAAAGFSLLALLAAVNEGQKASEQLAERYPAFDDDHVVLEENLARILPLTYPAMLVASAAIKSDSDTLKSLWDDIKINTGLMFPELYRG